MRDEDILGEISLTDTIDCQEMCAMHDDCAVFNMKNTTCHLLRKDYRSECDLMAGTNVIEDVNGKPKIQVEYQGENR